MGKRIIEYYVCTFLKVLNANSYIFNYPDMRNSRREFIRKSFLLSGVAELNMPSTLSEEHFLNKDGDRLVLLGAQRGPFIRSYKQIPSANVVVYKSIPFVIA